MIERFRNELRELVRALRTTRGAFRNWVKVGVVAGLAAPSVLPPKSGLTALSGIRMSFRTRLGPVLETEAGNSSPIVEVFRNGEYDVPVDWESLQLIVDVGAHVGAFTCWAAVRAPAARIVSFEPEPRNYADLVANVSRNELGPRVSTVNAAVGSTDGVVELRIPVHRDTTSSAATEGRLTTVPSVDFKRFLAVDAEGRVDLLKMDCEGAEWEVLGSLDPAAWERIGCLVLECHAGADRTIEDMIELLEGAGFEVSILERLSSGVAWYSEIATLWASAPGGRG
jgi:FkbM family methyltransferase